MRVVFQSLLIALMLLLSPTWRGELPHDRAQPAFAAHSQVRQREGQPGAGDRGPMTSAAYAGLVPLYLAGLSAYVAALRRLVPRSWLGTLRRKRKRKRTTNISVAR